MRKYLVAALALGTVACGDLLEKQPLSNIGSESFYQTEKQALAAVNAVYDPLGPLYSFKGGMVAFGDIAADGIEAGGRQAPFDEHSVDPTNAEMLSFWENSYVGINRANAAIARLPEAALAPDLSARLVGEAKFLRALYYFNLVRIWGGVPMPLTESASLDGLELSRASGEEVYAQIIRDLEDAEATLSVQPAEAGRATSGAAMALLGKVYLTLGEFGEARAKAQGVVMLGAYDLRERYADVFALANENGRESIFDVQYGANAGEGTDLPESSLPRAMEKVIAGGPPTPTLVIDTALIAAYEPGDTRRDLNVVTSYTVGGTTYRFEDTPLSFKYNDGMLQNDVGDAANNWPVLRYADVLLMLAEAENEVAGPTPAAYGAVNTVRRRAFGVPLNVPSEHDLAPGLGQAEFRHAVWRERFREFPLEGQHWFDLARTGRLVPTLGVPDFRSLYPLPQRDLDVNESLAQNPGY